MNPITSFLHLCARNGRWVLVAGLFTGIFIQPLAELIQPYVGHVVAVLLFLAALRIRPSEAVGKVERFTKRTDIHWRFSDTGALFCGFGIPDIRRKRTADHGNLTCHVHGTNLCKPEPDADHGQ